MQATYSVSTNSVLTNEKSKSKATTPTPPETSETKLVAEAKRGRRAAFGELCRPCWKALLARVHRITKNREDAEDALQDSLLRAFAHIRDFDGRSSFSTWLTRIAINSALMILRKRRKSMEIATTEEETPGCWDVPDGLPNPEKRCAQREREELLQVAIARLRPSIRIAVQLKDIHERSIRETARVLEISEAAAKGRLFQARSALRKSYALRGIARAGRESAA